MENPTGTPADLRRVVGKPDLDSAIVAVEFLAAAVEKDPRLRGSYADWPAWRALADRLGRASKGEPIYGATAGHQA